MNVYGFDIEITDVFGFQFENWLRNLYSYCYGKALTENDYQMELDNLLVDLTISDIDFSDMNFQNSTVQYIYQHISGYEFEFTLFIDEYNGFVQLLCADID